MLGSPPQQARRNGKPGFDPALVAFPEVGAAVDRRQNARLAEIDHETLEGAAKGHAARRAAVPD